MLHKRKPSPHDQQLLAGYFESLKTSNPAELWLQERKKCEEARRDAIKYRHKLKETLARVAREFESAVTAAKGNR
jgi:hypothetical protein